MADKSSASLCWIVLPSVCFLVSASQHVTDVTAEPGQNVTLPCKGSVRKDIVTVEWRRDERKVCVNTDPERSPRCVYEDRSFKNRVQLSNDFKNRDVSLVLINVRKEDGGRYECYVQQTHVGRKRRERPEEMTLLSTVNLEVEPGDTAQQIEGKVNEDGGGMSGVAIAAGVVSVALLALGVGGVVLYRQLNKDSDLRQKPVVVFNEEEQY